MLGPSRSGRNEHVRRNPAGTRVCGRETKSGKFDEAPRSRTSHYIMSTWANSRCGECYCLVPAIVCGSWPSVARHSANGCWPLTSELCHVSRALAFPTRTPTAPIRGRFSRSAIGGRPVSGRLGDARRRPAPCLLGRSLPRRRTAAPRRCSATRLSRCRQLPWSASSWARGCAPRRGRAIAGRGATRLPAPQRSARLPRHLGTVSDHRRHWAGWHGDRAPCSTRSSIGSSR